MNGRIYLRSGAELVAMDEKPYEVEAELQKLLADYPDLLAGDQMDSQSPRRWLLVTREMPVQGEHEGASLWSLDHLFLDQDAVPTLVEVKRSTNTDVRRKVVGQMLDYAANAATYWSVERVEHWFEQRCRKNGMEPEKVLGDFLGEDGEPAAYWQRVSANLTAGKIRLVFVADVIPPELRRVVEFLNERMDPTEVLAVEVRQYSGGGSTNFVPRVIGQTEAARGKKHVAAKAGKQWDEESLLESLQTKFGPAARDAAKELLHWIAGKVTHTFWGVGKDGGAILILQQGKTKHYVCRLMSHGNLVFRFDWLRTHPPFDNEAKRTELRRRIGEIRGYLLPEDQTKQRVWVPFTLLADPSAMRQLKSIIDWMIEQIHLASTSATSTP